MAEGKGDDSATCLSGYYLTLMLTKTSECDVRTEEIISSLIGLTAGPVWLLGHFLLLSARSRRPKKGRLPTCVTWSLLPHCVADVISCAGAVLAAQLFPQVVFAVTVLCVHCLVALVLILRHCLCSRTEYDLHGESLVTTGCTVTAYGWCPLEFCTLSLLMVVTLVSADVTPPRDVGNGKAGAAREAHVVLSLMPWWEISGEVLGGVACLGHWVASLCDASCMYKSSTRHWGREAGGVLLMVAGNVAYLVTVLWPPAVLWIHTLPWTLTRVGLLGINVGMLLLPGWKRRRKREKLRHDADVDESLLSTSTGSDGDSESDVLWDSTWRDRLCSGPTKTNFQKFQPAPPPCSTLNCLSQGTALQPPSRTAAYDLLQSTETSCSRTAEQDTELEYELNVTSHSPVTASHRDIPLAHLSPLTPEARQYRVVQWVEKSSPDDERHVMEEPDGIARCREHSGSFSQARSVLGLPSARKNSATF